MIVSFAIVITASPVVLSISGSWIYTLGDVSLSKATSTTEPKCVWSAWVTVQPAKTQSTALLAWRELTSS